MTRERAREMLAATVDAGGGGAVARYIRGDGSARDVADGIPLMTEWAISAIEAALTPVPTTEGETIDYVARLQTLLHALTELRDTGKVPGMMLRAVEDEKFMATLTRSPPSDGEVERLREAVAGPVWQEKSGDWSAEIQAVGGHYVLATVYGETEDDAIALRESILAALDPGQTP